MARMKTEKKLVSFLKSNLINQLVKEKSELENRSESSIIEQAILDSLMPANKNASDIIEHYLYSENGNIGSTLAAFFSYNAAGINWHSRYDNFLPLVQFAKKNQAYCNTILTGKEDELYHSCSQIESIISIIEDTAKKKTEDKFKYQQELKFANHLLNELREEPQFSRLINFYTLILDNWDILKDWSVTYRLLMDLSLLEKGWKNDSQTRTELVEIIKRISIDWD